MSDDSLKAAVMRVLADNDLVHPEEIAVAVLDGDVTLRGTVGSPIQHREAARTARGVLGVRRVDDQLVTKLLGIDGLADADTEAAVLDALIADDELHAADIDVDVDGDTVTLRGVVEMPAQRERARSIALRVGGVRHVSNLLRVWLTVSADDVAARVTQAVGVGTITGADEIEVVVHDSDVTLTGTVSSRAHREAALEAAANAPGVAGVHDALDVRVRS
jgi:hyperosmotically inducible periplasmic protein